MSNLAKVIRTDVNGNPNSKIDVSENRLKLLIRVVDRQEFSVEWDSRWAVKDIAAKWDITTTDAEALRHYWALPDRAKSAPAKSLGGTKVKKDLEPWVRQIIQEQVGLAILAFISGDEGVEVFLQHRHGALAEARNAHDNLLQVIDAKVAEAVEKALS